MHEFDTSIYQLDMATTDDSGDMDLHDIKNPKEIFVWQRGDIRKKQGLRLMIRMPPGMKNNSGQDLTVSNIYDTTTGRHIKYGAQFADHISMGVSAVIIPGSPADRIDCYKPSTKQQPPPPQVLAEQSSSLFASESNAAEIATAAKSSAPFPFPKSVGRKYNW
jgi:hypothetical protein